MSHLTTIIKYIDFQRKKTHKYIKEMEKRRISMLEEGKKIADTIAKTFNPIAIYIFGSVLNPKLFESYSDLDIAIEGLGVEDFYKAHAIAEDISSYNIDFVNFDRVPYLLKERIISKGIKVYEKK